MDNIDLKIMYAIWGARELATKELAIKGLLTDGAHHKQWYLEEILKAIGYDLKDIEKELEEDDYGWEKGIAP